MEEISGFSKAIKKNIYGKSQAIQAIFPPGMGAIALDEVQFILSHLWFPQKLTPICALLNTYIYINPIHLFAVTELMIRTQCLSDIRLIIFEGKVRSKWMFEKKCQSIQWSFFLDKKMSLKIKVNSVASIAFHETSLKTILSTIVEHYVDKVVSGDEGKETTCLYAMLYKNKLTLSISLAGKPLYKRGYRGILSASAPIREDIAACCIRQAFKFAYEIAYKKISHFKPDTLIIPFCGTGTFAFEFLQNYYQISSILLNRKYGLQYLPFFRKENFNYLLKKAKENCLLSRVSSFPKIENKTLADFNGIEKKSISISVQDRNFCESQIKQKNIHLEKQESEQSDLHFYCIDNSKDANIALCENMDMFEKRLNNNDFIFPNNLFVVNEEKKPYFMTNFFEINIKKFFEKEEMLGNIFIPLNPPYGIRLNKKLNQVQLYKNIANKINEISQFAHKKNKILGFILCPNEETWSAFYKELIHSFVHTYHLTQGGLDIRVCQFFVSR